MAFEPQFIVDLVQHIAHIHKERVSKSKRNEELPEYYPGYNLKVQHYDSIRVHSEKDFPPTALLNSKSPNESDEELAYRVANYRQDMTVFEDYLNTVDRVFHPSNWSQSFDETPTSFGDNTFEEYVDSKFIGTMNLEQYMLNIVNPVKAKDAEGVQVIRPKDIKVDEEGRIVSDQLIEPIPVYYNVKRVMNQSIEDHVLVQTSRRSIVTIGPRRVKEGLIYEFYDDENIWEIVQIGDKKDLTFEIILIFNHGWGVVPAIKNMGKPLITAENDLVYESPFLSSVDHLNEALTDRSNLGASKSKCVFPVTIMVGNECQFSEPIDGEHVVCHKGWMSYSHEGNLQRKKCPDCNGSGLANRISPTGTILVNPGGLEDPDGQEVKAADAVRFVSPEITTLEFLQTQIIHNTEEARRTIFLPTRFDTTGDEKTATEIDDQKDAREAFLQGSSNQTFSIFQFISDAISWMRYKLDSMTNIIKPTTFDFTSEFNFIREIGVMHEKGIDPAIIQDKTSQYVQTVYGSKGGKTVNRMKLWLVSDTLVGITAEEIGLQIGRRTIERWQEILHTSAFSLMQELVDKSDTFFEQELKDQVTQLQELAQTKANAVPPLVDNTNIVDSIVNLPVGTTT